MANIISTATIRPFLDPSGVEQGKERVVRALNEVAASGDKVETSISKVGRSAALSAGGFDKFFASIDANVARAQQYQRDLDRLNRYQEAGVATGAQYSSALQSIERKYADLTGATGRASTGQQSFNQALGFGRTILGAFGVALSVGAVVSYGRSIFNAAANLTEMAQQVGVGVEELQAFHGVMLTSGISINETNALLQRLTRSIGEGSKAFEQLGISGEQLAEGTPAVFQLIAQRLMEIESASKRAAIETDLFGRSGQKLEAALPRLTKATKELVDEQTRLGNVLSKDVAEGADTAGDRITQAMHSAAVSFTPLAQAIGDAIAKLLELAVAADKAKRASWDAAMAPMFPDARNLGQELRAGASAAGIPFRAGGPNTIPASSAPAFALQPGFAGDAGADAAVALKTYEEGLKRRLDLDREYLSQVSAQIEAAGRLELEQHKRIQDSNNETAAKELALKKQILGEIDTLSENHFAGEIARAKDAEQEKEASLREEARAWQRMYDDVFRDGQNFFDRFFETGKADLDDFLNLFRRTWTRALADMATEKLLMPLMQGTLFNAGTIMGLGGGAGGGMGGSAMGSAMGGVGLVGSIGGFFGGGNSGGNSGGFGGGYGQVGAALNRPLYGVGGTFGGSGAPSSSSLGSVFGAAGTGAAVGGVAGAASGGNNTGATVGGAIGGVIGSIWGPIGTVVGSALGGLIGGMVGGGKPSNYTAYANFGSDYSLIGGVAGDKPNAQTTSAAQQAGQAIAEAARNLQEAGIQLSSGVQRLEIGQRDVSRVFLSSGQRVNVGGVGDVQQAVSGTLDYLLKGATSSTVGGQAALNQLRGSGGVTSSEIDSLLGDIGQIGAMESETKKAIDQLTNPVLSAWNDLMEAEDARAAQAKKFGLDTTLLERRAYLERQQFIRALTDEQRKSLGGLIDLSGELAARVADAQRTALSAIGVQMGAASEYGRDMRGSARDYYGASRSLGESYNALLIGELSPLDPMGRYNQARSQFQNLGDRAARGDLESARGLSGLSSDFLTQSLNVHGSTKAYGQDFSFVQSILGAAGVATGAFGDTATRAADLAEEQVTLLEQIRDNVGSSSPSVTLLQQQLASMDVIAAEARGLSSVFSASVERQLAALGGVGNSTDAVRGTLSDGIAKQLSSLGLIKDRTSGVEWQLHSGFAGELNALGAIGDRTWATQNILGGGINVLDAPTLRTALQGVIGAVNTVPPEFVNAITNQTNAVVARLEAVVASLQTQIGESKQTTASVETLTRTVTMGGPQAGFGGYQRGGVPA